MTPVATRRAGAAPRPTATPPQTSRLETVWLKDVKKVPIEWLWKPYLQRRAINLLTGDPGSGKSTIICDIAAALSRGRPLPGDSEPRSPCNTWIMNGEDAMNDTIAWRLDNQGADPNRVLITDQATTIDLQVAREIARTVVEAQISLLVVDPLQAWMGSDVDMNRANETREWSSLLRRVALETGCAIVFVRHRRKGQPGDNKLYSGLGSIDITGFARVETSAIVGKEGQRFITRSKGSVGQTGKALKYDILPSEDPGNDHGVLQWGHEFVEEASVKVTKVPKALKQAMDWLKKELAQGPRLATDMIQAHKAANISDRTMRRAKIGLVDSYQASDNAWVWQLIPQEAEGDLICTR
jgi:hypothetical protein